MALNFPSTPSDGDTFEGYTYDATNEVWNHNPYQIAARFVTSATAPANPSEGDGWFDTNTAKSYIYYDSVWVQVGALGSVTLDQIGDIDTAGVSDGESLVYDSATSTWVSSSRVTTGKAIAMSIVFG